jgi:hypothetical protein
VGEFLETAKLGYVVVTPAAERALEENETEAMALLWRHATGDWGHVGRSGRIDSDLFAIQDKRGPRSPDSGPQVVG